MYMKLTQVEVRRGGADNCLAGGLRASHKSTIEKSGFISQAPQSGCTLRGMRWRRSLTQGLAHHVKEKS